MRNAVFLTDTVNEALANKFLVQAQDPTFRGRWDSHIQPQALELIRLRLHDITYRTLCPLDQISIWPNRLPNTLGEPQRYTLLEIAETVQKLYAPEAAPQTSIEQRCREAAFVYDMKDQSVEETHLMAYLMLVKHNYLGSALTSEQDDTLAKILYKKLPQNSGMLKQFNESTASEVGKGLDTVLKAVYRLKGVLAMVRQSIRIATSYGPDNFAYRIDSRDKEITNSSHSSSSSSSSSSISTSSYNAQTSAETKRINKRSAADCEPPTAYVEKCECCGGWGHSTYLCRWSKHPMANNSLKNFANSTAASIWRIIGLENLRHGKTIPGYDTINKNDYPKLDNVYNKNHKNASDAKSNKRSKVSANYKGTHPKPYDQLYNSNSNSNSSSNSSNSSSNNNNYNRNDNPSYSNSNQSMNTQGSKSLPAMLCSLINDNHQSEYLNVTVTKCKQITGLKTAQPTMLTPGTNLMMVTEDGALRGEEMAVETNALLDTGSLPGNFISIALLLKIKGTDCLYKTDQPMRVCSGLDNHCVDSIEVIDVLVSFKIKNKTTLLPQYFFHKDCNQNEKDTTPNRRSNCSIAPSGCDTIAKVATLASGPYNGLNSILVGYGHHSRNTPTNRVHFDEIPLKDITEVASPSVLIDTPSKTWGTVATILKQNEQLSEVDLIVSDEIDCDIKDTFGPFKNPDALTEELSDADFLAKIVIQGTRELQEEIKKILLEFKDIFSDRLRPNSADIPPFDLEVDKSKWETIKNRGPVRVQTEAKQKEIQKQTQEMLAAGIIEKSPASFYSQVHIAPKPNGFRFCIDYRKLNDATESASWPIPNIQQMLIRIGAHHALIYGIMDLTSGYHQAPISLSTRIFTAFITFAGIFQFTRLPFGPKRAPSYFQEMMASVVLLGLIYFICEV